MTGRVHVLHSAHIRTLDAAGRIADAIAWCDGQLIAIGTREEVTRAAGANATLHDAGGAAVLPGFIDPHQHPSIVAIYDKRVALGPPAVRDIASLQRTLAAASAKLAPGRWLVATGWDESQLAEHRAPTLAELDDAVPDRPLMAMHYTCHRAAANSAALQLAGIDRHTPDPSGGLITRRAGGEPDAVLIERGMSRVESLARASQTAHDAETFFANLATHHGALVAAGITRVVDATVPPELVALYYIAAERGLLIVPTVMMPVSAKGYLEAPWDALEGPVTGEERGLLTVGPVKLVFDGAPGCAMCLGWWQLAGVTVRSFAASVWHRSLDPLRTAMSVTPRLGRSIRTGINIYQREEARDVVRRAVERGFSLATHAIGNDAIDVAVSAYEAAGPGLGRAGIPRIEHASFLDRELVARIAGCGAAVVTQPHFLSLEAFEHASAIPGLPNMPLRWLLDAKVKLAGSSDYPVAGFDPLDGIRAAVTRRTPRGRLVEPDQAIDLEEAIVMYTRAAAEVSGCIDRCGTLEKGKRADVVVLDGPLANPSHLASARVRATVINGKLVFGSLAG